MATSTLKNRGSRNQVGTFGAPFPVGGSAFAFLQSDAALTRPNNTTAYAANQGVGSSGSCLFKWTDLFKRPGGLVAVCAARLAVCGSADLHTAVG